jgi:hypothetical protein
MEKKDFNSFDMLNLVGLMKKKDFNSFDMLNLYKYHSIKPVVTVSIINAMIKLSIYFIVHILQ